MNPEEIDLFAQGIITIRQRLLGNNYMPLRYQGRLRKVGVSDFNEF